MILGGWCLNSPPRCPPAHSRTARHQPPPPRGRRARRLGALEPRPVLSVRLRLLCGTANATQTAAALSAQLTGGLEPDSILSVVLSGLGLFLLSRLGGIPVPDRPEGVVLYVIWMAVQLLQYVTVLFSLIMSAASLFHATHALEGCARNPAAVSWSLYLTLGVQPALVAPALVLFLYAYAFSTGLKVWTATRAMAKSEGDREALVQTLKNSTQSHPVASFHYWLAYTALASTCAGLVLSGVALPVAALLLPASAVIVVAVKGIYWVAGPIERGLLPKPEQCYGIDLGAGLTTWLNELHDSSFAPGGFSLDATLRSPAAMRANRDDPALATLGLSLGVFWLLLALAVPVCYGMWLTLPLLLGGASVSEVAEAALALSSALLDSLSALLALEWRWAALLDVDALLAFVQQPVASLKAAIGYVLDLAWYLDISYAELLDGASQLLVLNSVLAIIKPVTTAAAKATPVLTRLLTRAQHDQVGAIGFGECVPGELEGLCAKVGMTVDEVTVPRRWIGTAKG